jgi:hypothetical protein
MAKIIKDYPPNYEKIKEVFNPPESACYCYGDDLYNPSGNKLEEHILVHENVHRLQQNGDPETWWNKYLVDKEFRKNQEVEAYKVQYNFIKLRTTEKIYSQFLDLFAQQLSSMYDLGITKYEAHTLIRKSMI